MGRTPSERAHDSDAAPSSSAPASEPAPDENARKGRLRGRVRDVRTRADETKRDLLERAEKERDRRQSVRAVFDLLDVDRGRGGGLLSGGLAYRLFIWLLPASLVITSLIRIFADLGDEPPSDMAKDVGMGAAVAASVGRAAAQAGGTAPFLLVFGLALTLWASRSVLKALRLVSVIAWGMRPEPLRSPVRPTLITAGILLVAPIYGFLVAPLYGGALWGDVLATVLAITGLAATAAWGASKLPHPDGVGWVEFLPGALLFAVGMEALRLATTLYFASKLERIDDLYGALGFAAVFMAYLYLVARLIVVGLMANAAVRRARPSRESVDQRS